MATQRSAAIESFMKSKTKIWLGVGAFVVAGVNRQTPKRRTRAASRHESASGIAITQALSGTRSLRRTDDATLRAGGEACGSAAEASQQGGELLSAAQDSERTARMAKKKPAARAVKEKAARAAPR